jgi:hypothetical protein
MAVAGEDVELPYWRERGGGNSEREGVEVFGRRVPKRPGGFVTFVVESDHGTIS